MVPGNGFQNHLEGRVREAYPPSMRRWSVVKQPDKKPRAHYQNCRFARIGNANKNQSTPQAQKCNSNNRKTTKRNRNFEVEKWTLFLGSILEKE